MVVEAVATEPASQVEVVITVCFWDIQHTVTPERRNMNPLVDFLVSKHPSQSESLYPTGSRELVQLYERARFLVT